MQFKMFRNNAADDCSHYKSKKNYRCDQILVIDYNILNFIKI